MIQARTPLLLVGMVWLSLCVVGLSARAEAIDDRVTSGTLPITVDLDAHCTFARLESEFGMIHVLLYKGRTPLTVQNFLTYASDGDYDDTIIHRSIPGFVIQGGGYHVAEGGLAHIDVDAPVQNEPGISNVRGTIAMAKSAGNPDSATSEWFFSLGDNSANLDAQNGGFTVFGRAVGDGMDLVDQIAAIPWYTFASPFSNIPLEEDYAGGSLTFGNLVWILSVREVAVANYSSVSVGDSGLLSAQVDQGILTVTPTGTKTGQTTVTLEVTNADGVVATETLTVSVQANDSPVQSSALSQQTAHEGVPFSWVVPGTLFVDDDPGDSLTYSASLENGVSLPTWLAFSPLERQLNGQIKMV